MLKSKITLVVSILSFFCLGATPPPPKPPADTTPPTVSITPPPIDKATVSGNVNIQAEAKDNVGVTKVEFYVDNALKSTDTASPYAYTWDTSTATNAGHALKVKAYDAKNNSKETPQISVTVNNTTPPPPPPPTPGSELTIFAASASSSNSSYPAARAIDKNLSSYWQGYWSWLSKPSAWWLVLDLNKNYTLSKVSIFWHNAYGSTNYAIQGSTDNKTWVNLQTNQTSAGGKANLYQKDYGLTGTYRYIRIYINKAQNNYPIIYEVKLYGSLPEALPPKITGVIPQDGTVSNESEGVNVSVTLNDGAYGAEYQFYVDGVIKQAWSKESVLKWTAHPGRHDIKVEAKNAKGSDSKEIELFCFRKPISPP